MNILKQKFRSIKKFPTWIYWLPARLMQLSLHTLYRYEMIDPETMLWTHHAKAAQDFLNPASVNKGWRYQVDQYFT